MQKAIALRGVLIYCLSLVKLVISSPLLSSAMSHYVSVIEVLQCVFSLEVHHLIS